MNRGLFGVSGGGAVIGVIVYGPVDQRRSRRIVFGLPALVLLIVPPLFVVLAVQMIGGMASEPLTPVLSTVEYERIPRSCRGRILGAMTVGAT